MKINDYNFNFKHKKSFNVLGQSSNSEKNTIVIEIDNKGMFKKKIIVD